MKIQNGKQTKTCLRELVSLSPEYDKVKTKQKHSSNRWLKNDTIIINDVGMANFNNISYDEFIYTDKLTNKKIRMRDAKTSYQNGRHVRNSTTMQLGRLPLNPHKPQKRKRQSRISRHQSNFQLQKQVNKQLTDLNQCYLMLKSTQMFKMNSLRQKIFASVERSNNTKKLTYKHKKAQQTSQQQLKNMMMKKKKIRDILQDSVKQANMKQFRKYYDNKQHKINNKILSMNRHLPKSLNKNNIQKIISTLQSGDKHDQKLYKIIMKQPYKLQEFPGQQKLRVQLFDYMHKQIKQNGEYLIVPEKKKLLFQRLYNNAVMKNGDMIERKEKMFTEKRFDNNQNKKYKQTDSETDSTIEINIQSQSEKTIGENKKDRYRSSKEIQLGGDCGLLTMTVGKEKKVKFNNQVNSKNYGKQQQDVLKRKQKVKNDNTCILLHSYENRTAKCAQKNQPFSYNARSNKQNKKPPSQITSYLNQFQFQPCQKDNQISMIRFRFQKNIRLSSKKYDMKQQRFLFLIQNGLIFQVQKQILMNQQYLFIKDKCQDNLLHICAKNHYTEMFCFILERYRKVGNKKDVILKYGEDLVKDRLVEKNKNNKNVLEVARLYQAQEIIEILMKLKEEFNIKQYSDVYNDW